MTDTKKRMGRPPHNPTGKHYKFNDLHAVLVRSLPFSFMREDESAPGGMVIDTLALARALGVSRFTVYRALNQDRLSKQVAHGLLAIPGSFIKQEDLLPFLMRL